MEKRVLSFVLLVVLMPVLYGADQSSSLPVESGKQKEKEKEEEVLIPKIEDYFVCGHVARQSSEKDLLFLRFIPEDECIEFKQVIGHPALIKQLQKVSKEVHEPCVQDDLFKLIELAKGAHVRGKNDETYITRLRELRQMKMRVVEETGELKHSGLSYYSMSSINGRMQSEVAHKDAVVFPQSAVSRYAEIRSFPPTTEVMNAKRFAQLITKMMENENDYNRGSFIIALKDQANEFFKVMSKASGDKPTGWQVIESRGEKQRKKKSKLPEAKKEEQD